MSKIAAAPVTQRAYTLRLRGATPEDQTWRERLASPLGTVLRSDNQDAKKIAVK